MKIETAERLVAALDQAAIHISGGKELEGSVSEVICFLESLLSILGRFKSRAQVREALLDFDEPPSATVSLIEGALRHTPRLLSGWFRKKTTAHTESQEGQTGRPDIISPELCRVVCDEVAIWDRRGRSHAESKKLVAMKYGVSPKTIHRIWVRRSQYPLDGVTLLRSAKIRILALRMTVLRRVDREVCSDL